MRHLLFSLLLLLPLVSAACNTSAPATSEAITYRYDNLPDEADTSAAVAEFRAISKWHKYDLTYSFINSTNKLAGESERELVREAFAIWAAATPLTFNEVGSGQAADIEIGWYEGDYGFIEPFDGPGNVLAHATFPNPFAPQQVYLHFDNTERWVNSLNENVDLLSVAIHEIGHVLGLGHSRDPRAIMYASYSGPNRTLSADDIAGVTELYGVNSTAEAPTTPPAGAEVPPSTNVDSDSDGLSDAEEVYITGTGPQNRDTDGDGVPDGLEVLYRMNPLDPDMDKDGVNDGDEIRASTNPFFPDQQAAVSAELVQQVSQYLSEAIHLEIRALRTGDAAVAAPVLSADVLALLEQQITLLNQQGQVQLSTFDYYNSYLADVRLISNRQIEVDSCERWSTAVFDKATGAAVRSTGTQLIPQTITLRQLDIGWRITAVEFREAPAFCR